MDFGACNLLSSSSSEASAFQQVLGDSHSSLPVWSQSYAGSSPLFSQVELESFAMNGEIVHGEGQLLGKGPHPEEKLLVRENISTTEHYDHQWALLTSYAGAQTGQTPLVRTAGALSQQQQNLRRQSIQSGEGNSLQQYCSHSAISQAELGAGGGNAVNGAARPRVRARRGQATDPHSIAERLRRERIAERIKSLQELVPNSNKNDKASMLDEIIDYVKFLQLQVKVLSMSRLGGAGAVAPLIADVPPEGTGGLMSTALGQAGGSLPLSQEGLAFEQEVAKLMESNMTTAMQYLQNKGLCLMPIALASAISSSSGKSPVATVPGKGVDSSERHKSDMQSAVLPFSGSSTALDEGNGDGGEDLSTYRKVLKKILEIHDGLDGDNGDKDVHYSLQVSNDLRDLGAISKRPKALKIVGAKEVKDFRPISLCNTSYKILTKIIAGRIQMVLPNFISGNHGDFVPGRQITDSIIVIQEAIHSIEISGRLAMFLKLDMHKAFDMITWSFLQAILLKVSGQMVDFYKSVVFFINVENKVQARLARILECRIKHFPDSYLGMPLIHKNPNLTVWNALLERVNSKLSSWKGLFLSQVVKIQLLQISLQGIPIYVMSLFILPAKIKEALEKIQKRFLYMGAGEKFKFPLVAWDKVTKPKLCGGLGLKNIYLMNEALITKAS
ncbi:hypothetical protein KI387_007796 [Taxus chinensis]|uniref:BHLH domain-containing protein n=1 Tax=Taxus chinensis TaxID=29808 RepID=A0AA38LK00_TAXCH|nr:hypothetical protein KI387_007796 [Taxus chinensis]